MDIMGSAKVGTPNATKNRFYASAITQHLKMVNLCINSYMEDASRTTIATILETVHLENFVLKVSVGLIL